MAKHNTVFSVQSGGHSLNKGVSSTADGVVISLSQFREISLDKVAGTVRIGTGNRWGYVYDTLAEHGYAVSGGRVGSVGVGGLSLGGGLSYFLYSHGFVCDSIVEYEVVTAGGRVLAVTAASHPDLFVALKGSGAPFVLVTSFVFRLVEIDRSGRAYGGGVRSDGSTIPAVLRAVADFNAPGGGVDDTASHVFALSTYGAVSIASVHLFYRWPQAAPPPALRGLAAAGSAALLGSTLGNRTLTSIAGDVPAPDGLRQTVSSLTAVDPSTDDLLRLDEIAREEVAAANLGPQIGAMFVWVPCGPLAEGPNARNVLGLVKPSPVEDGGSPQRRYMALGFGLSWTDSGQDAPIDQLASRVIKRSKEYLASVGHLSPFVYISPLSSPARDHGLTGRQIHELRVAGARPDRVVWRGERGTHPPGARRLRPGPAVGPATARRV